MKVVTNESGIGKVKGAVVTLGNFDGLHLGHQKILRKVYSRANKLARPSLVYTFEPHPLKVVAPGKSPPIIISLGDKLELLEGFGIGCCVLARFTKELAQTHPEEFVREVLVGQLSAREVWVGHDFSFGRGRKGTVRHLKTLGKKFGFKVFVLPAYRKLGSIVSSSRVRGLIKKGDVEEAGKLLGRYFSLKGKVVRGRDIGRKLGFPTANLVTPCELIPKDGVYAGFVSFNGKGYQGVINIGRAPTFRRISSVIEVHILDFRRSIYGKDIRVSLVKRIRDEVRFKRAEDLAGQIKRDILMARKILSRKPAPLRILA
ncbi:MAG: bifunctional riboflavin kinase/FAD synthetase [Deltaproteobacteria bacterium]|nr:bifunctional riboflavin kinase/FAD synthetase [Deltaproteobacteria bacterium]